MTVTPEQVGFRGTIGPGLKPEVESWTVTVFGWDGRAFLSERIRGTKRARAEAERFFARSDVEKVSVTR